MPPLQPECRIDYHMDRQASRFTMDIPWEYALKASQEQILRGIVARATEELAKEFVRLHGDAILAGVKPELVTTKVVEGVVQAMLRKLRE